MEKKTSLQPLSDRVLVKRVDSQDKIKGGIILPDSAKKKQERATVIATGPGKKDTHGNLIPMHVKVGQVVLMDKYSGQDITIDGEEFVVTRQDEIIAIVEE